LLSKLRKKSASPKKEEYFTIMILPGPNSKVRKFSISKTLLRNAGLSLLAGLVVSTLMFGEYVHMRGKVWELDSLRTETSRQRVQIEQFAGSIVDMKGQLARLQEVSERLRTLANPGGHVKEQQKLGIGGTSEMSSINLSELGQKTHKEMMDQMGHELEGMKAAAAEQEATMQKLSDFLEHRNSVIASTPGIWPVHGFITSNFGYRMSPIYGTRQFHEGIDIANRIGAPVEATANGTVVGLGYQTGYGKFVKVQHGYGISTLYGHLSDTAVKEGQRVKRGEVVGYVGNTGNSTGPHLHYEVRVNGVPTNPLGYL
jgi:hypothetical protein